MMDDLVYCKFTEVQLVPSIVKTILCRRWWSWSNLCFFIGSIFYVIDSIWDIVSAANGGSGDDDDFGDDDSDDSSSYDESSWVADLDWYKIIAVLGALFYLLEGVVDIYDTWRNQPSDRRKADILPVWGRYGIYTIFAIAAIFDLLGSLIDDASSSLSAVASHGYLLQAVLSVVFFPNSDYDDDDVYYSSDENEDNSCDETSSSSSSSSSLSSQEEEQWKKIKCIVKTGDFLFVLGSLIDVIISYMDLDGMEESNALQMVIWSLVSSLLWFMDAICYLLADAKEYNLYYRYESTPSLLSLTIHSTVLSEEGTEELPHNMCDYVLLEESNENECNENLDGGSSSAEEDLT